MRKGTWLCIVLSFTLILSYQVTIGQQLKLGKFPYAVEKSAVLELVSDNQGLLLPRISDTSLINAMNPPDGMVIYFTPDQLLYIRSNGYWKSLVLTGTWVTSLNGNTGALTMDTGYISNFHSKVRSLFSASAPLTYSNGQFGITQATTSTDGYLSSTDWNTFNNKQPAGNYLTDPGGNGIIARTALNTLVNRTLTGTTDRISLTNGDGVSGNPTIDIANTYAGQTSITTLGTIGTGTWNGSVIGATYGGTGQSSYTTGDILYASSSNTLSKLASVAAGSYLRSAGTSTAPEWSTTTLPNSATTGDLLYASAGNTYSNLAGVATGNALISGGVSTAPSWGKIGLTTHVSGVLPIANGGTNSSASLNNNRIMVSSAGAIVEAGALTNGQLLIGSTGAAPVAANLTAGSGITITNSAGGITIAAQRTLVTSSSSDVSLTTNGWFDVTGLSFTAAANTTYRFYAIVAFNSTSTGDGLDIACNGPASPSFLAYHSISSRTTSDVYRWSGNIYDQAGPATASLSGSNIAVVTGIIQTGANSGTFIIRVKASGANKLTVKTNMCSLEYW